MLFFISCEKDLYEESLIEQKRGITSRRISFNELKTNPNVIKELNNAKDKLKPNLIGNERIINVGNFFIETDDVLLLEYGGLKSYTFPVYFTEEDAKLKNLVIAEKLDGTYTSKVLEYDLTAQEKIDLANDELKTITNPILITRLNYTLECHEVFVIEIVPCSHPGGPHNASNPEEWWHCRADVKPTIKVITQVVCGFNGGGDPIWDNPGNPPDTGGTPTGTGGTPSGLPPDYPNSQTNPEEYENGITQPINPNINLPTNTPCARIKSKTNTTDYMLKFNNINTTANNGLDEETGFAEVKRNGNLQYIDGIPDGDRKLKIPDDSVGYTHVHNNKNIVDDDGNVVDLSVKIHSKPDIDKLLRCSTRASLNLGSPLDAYGVMISNEGIFAITITDTLSSVGLNARLKKFEKDYDFQSLDIIEAHHPLALKKRKMQEMFLALLKNAGLENKIALFEGSTQTIAGITKINWVQKTLDTNGNLFSTPCQ